jgi:hypothetical protein
MTWATWPIILAENPYRNPDPLSPRSRPTLRNFRSAGFCDLAGYTADLDTFQGNSGSGVVTGLGRIVALYYGSSTLHQIR